MNAPAACEGAPRDLGCDQGRACAEALRARFAAEPLHRRLRLWLGSAGRPAGGLHRELRRHFPRQAETLAGLAAAADVPIAWLVLRLERETRPGRAELAAAAGGGAQTGASVGCAVTGEWIARRSRPEGGFRCVELTRPWLAHALIGVNEAGLAVAVSSGGPPGAGENGAPAAALLAAPNAALPAAPLATDCLQRFASVEACLDWCTGRPGDRPATLLFADAAGEIAGVERAPGLARVLRSAEGWLAVGGAPDARERLAKTLRGGARPDAALAWAIPSARALQLGETRFEV